METEMVVNITNSIIFAHDIIITAGWVCVYVCVCVCVCVCVSVVCVCVNV